jgi:hypothetical protein
MKKPSASGTLGTMNRTLCVETSRPPFESERPLFQPHLRAEVTGDGVKLFADTMGADGLNIYVRTAGERAWQLLAPSQRQFPFHDRRPFSSGRLERRDYMAVGVFDGEEIGQSSPVVSAVWPRGRKIIS